MVTGLNVSCVSFFGSPPLPEGMRQRDPVALYAIYSATDEAGGGVVYSVVSGVRIKCVVYLLTPSPYQFQPQPYPQSGD